MKVNFLNLIVIIIMVGCSTSIIVVNNSDKVEIDSRPKTDTEIDSLEVKVLPRKK